MSASADDGNASSIHRKDLSSDQINQLILQGLPLECDDLAVAHVDKDTKTMARKEVRYREVTRHRILLDECLSNQESTPSHMM